ncbi:MAG: T9SS type A sorting domain-containing protein [Chitinophagaceae bacterium]|nr:T9SS type A sorting domain-containing protein [Chitinophagaceae bacterium]MBP7313669.1 T9SS type A sorting domain-containing protein [Chitinophagaceae bacterium]
MKQMYSTLHRLIPVLLVFLIHLPLNVHGQTSVNSIATSGSTANVVTYSNLKAAGLRNTSGGLISYWDSTGSAFTVNFNAPATINTLSLTQMTVSGISSSVIKMPTSGMVKIRRATNDQVGDDRSYFNFWAACSSIPASGATSGTFNFTAPEVLNPDEAFLSNNLTSGYDNIFQNTIASPHFGNIERIDFIIPSGLKPINDTDRIESGAVVFDRGGGDPFKIAAITAVDASNVPTAFGPLISIAIAQFGPSLFGAGFDYGIMINDVNYAGQSRPSTNNNQNIKGVFISLRDFGITVNQKFYGYAIFSDDVVTADPDWTTYPNNSNAGSQLDPVNMLGMFKSAKSVLSVPVNFEVVKYRNQSELNFTLYNKYVSDEVIIERSVDGINYTAIGSLPVAEAKDYSYNDVAPAEGNNFYRLFFKEKKGSGGYSQVKMVQFPKTKNVKVYPVPATDVLNLVVPDNWKNENIKVELWNQAGHLVQQNYLKVTAATFPLMLNKKQSGFYQLRIINTNDQVSVIKNITIIQ